MHVVVEKLSVILQAQSCAYAGVKIGVTLTKNLSRRQLSRTLAFVPQHAESEVEMSVINIVRLGRTPHRGAFAPWHQTDEVAVQQSLSMMKLDALAHRPWQRLSGGERQCCQIACALTQQPDILLLDKPDQSSGYTILAGTDATYLRVASYRDCGTTRSQSSCKILSTSGGIA